MKPEIKQQELPENLLQTQKGRDLAIHEVAKRRNADQLNYVINLMLKENPEANLNPFVMTNPITESGYDVFTLLKKPLEDFATKALPFPSSLAAQEAPYCPKCEKILRTRIALQKLDFLEEDALAPILSKLSQEDYDFSNLNSEELGKLSAANNSQIEEVKNFSSIYKREINSNIPAVSVSITSPAVAMQIDAPSVFSQK
jgi:thiol-disulfide isomerase/thioredoxin